MHSFDRIRSLLQEHPVVLFMRGSPERPMCRGSAVAAEALASVGAEYLAVDVQKDPELRAYLPKFADQAGFPVLFLSGELIGDDAIVRELCEQGELGPMVRGEAYSTALAS